MPESTCNHPEPRAPRPSAERLSRLLRARVADALGGAHLDHDALFRLDDEALIACLVVDRALTFQAIGAATVCARFAAPRLVPSGYAVELEGRVERAEVAGADELPVIRRDADDFGRSPGVDEAGDRAPAASTPDAAPLPVERTRPADPDAKVVTDDGATWPKLRRAMMGREPTVARMVEDLEGVAREKPGEAILDADLMRKGWTIGQVRDHGRLARDRFREARAAAGRADEEARS